MEIIKHAEENDKISCCSRDDGCYDNCRID